jgi:uncharacterized protein (TIGR00288 family)
MPENNALSHVSDVAMFIDWENMHGSIRGKANLSALREVAESFGRLVLAKAYADWREDKFQDDSLLLYRAGVEPIYVPNVHQPNNTVKNNVDVKLATDCIDFAHRFPNIEVFILVTGDGDFIHVVSALRPLGKKVIAVAQSNNASARLSDLVDIMYIYERDVNPHTNHLSEPAPKSPQPEKPKNVEEIYQKIVEFIHDENNAPILLTNVKQRLMQTYDKFDQNDYGFGKFKALIKAGADAGYFTLNTAGLREWLTLPSENKREATVELPGKLDDVFREIADLAQSSNDSKILFANVKPHLIKQHGGFDESIYGFTRFKELMQEGQRLGYFTIGKNDKSVDYVHVKGKRKIAV